MGWWEGRRVSPPIQSPMTGGGGGGGTGVGDATTPGSIFFHWPGMKNEIITYRQCNYTSFHCLTAFSFPFTKNGNSWKLVEFASSFSRWELERVSATDILFLPPLPSLGKHAPRARSDREGRSPEMGRRKKRKKPRRSILNHSSPLSPYLSR